MKLLYISALSSEKLVNDIYHKTGRDPGFAVQKFSRLIVKGLIANGNNTIALTNPPIMRDYSTSLFECKGTELENDVTYKYAPFINLPFIKQLCSFLYIFFYVLFWGIGNRKDKAILCDVLNVSGSTAALYASKLNGIKSVGVVTDIPGKGAGKPVGIVKKMGSLGAVFQRKMITSFGYYVLLTEQMNEIVNPNGRPHMIMEALCDSSIAKTESKSVEKDSPRTMLYAGGLHVKYGLKMLVDAFILSGVDGKLIIYGDGPYASELREVSNQTEVIEYRGVASNEDVVAAEHSATFLVNPRFTNESFSAYSFPSKNMEYMASGTPLLTTKLPGMPDEYHEYVYLFGEETVEAYAETISQVFAKRDDELLQKGALAKKFVLENKNNVAQAKRIVDFIRE